MEVQNDFSPVFLCEQLTPFNYILLQERSRGFLQFELSKISKESDTNLFNQFKDEIRIW